jgi:hypothetical protein
MHNVAERLAMLIDLLGDLMLAAALIVIGLALLFVYWVFGGGLWAWSQGLKERKEQERFEEADAERAQDWDQERAQELAEWLRQGVLPSPITRLYPAYQEFTWEWARLQAHGYELDHDPVQLDDGQLMVTYSLAAVTAAASEGLEPEDVSRHPYVLPSPPR